MSMHEEIVANINKDTGYNTGYQAGVKHAWDMLQQAADFYGDTGKLYEQSDPAKAERHRERRMALLYGQMLITKSKYKPETHGHV